jgi:uncharacterized protein (TIGR00251 family)
MKISVKVTPNSRVAEIREEGNSLLVKVKEPPKEGKANAAVVKAVARSFGVPPGSARIVSGHTGRSKVIEIDKGR